MPSSTSTILVLAALTWDEPTKWLVVAAAVLTIAYAVLRPMRKKRDPLENGAPRFSLAQQRAVEQQMSSLLVEMSEMARQVTAQLDTRSAKLELLIKEADEKLAVLKAHLSPAPTAQDLGPPPTNGNGGGNRQGATAAPAGRPLAAELAEPDPRHAGVYTLADQGCSAREIAQRLGRPDGEVELILALRARR